MSEKLFKYSHTCKSVRHYCPIKPVYIEAISEKGEIGLKEIIDYSVHENLIMYKIEHNENLFEPFWASEDHSLLVWDNQDEKVIKKSPLEILEEIKELNSRYQFISSIKDNNIKHVKEGATLIPIIDLKIILDPNETTAYDFTVKDWYTFKLDNGIYVQDSMACYFTITEEGEADLIKNVSIENNLLLDYDNTTTLRPNHDIVYGIYLLSIKKPERLPKPLYEYMVKNNYDMIDKGRLINFMTEYIKNNKNIDVFDEIMTLGFMISTRYNQTFLSIDNVINSIIPPKIRNELYEKYSNGEITMDEYMTEEDKLLKTLKEKCVFKDLINSGSRGSWGQAKQMFLQRGFVSNSAGETMPTPVKSNLAEGMSSRDLFLSCYGVRKGLSDIADNTAVSGTFGRALVYLGLEAKQGSSKKPCGTKRYVLFKPSTIKMCKSLIGRYIFEDDTCLNMSRITEENYKSYLNKDIRLRSPIYCEDKNYCHYCCPYVELKDIKKGRTYNVGVIAAQTLGEPTTQMVLRVFHHSGAVTHNDSNGADDDIVKDLRGVIRLFSKPNFDLSNINNYLKNLFLIYLQYKQVKMLYFEVLLSCLMWSKSNDNDSTIPDLLWRLNQDAELILVGHNKVPALTGFLLGCAFRNFKRMLLTSLNKEVGESVFEKLILE